MDVLRWLSGHRSVGRGVLLGDGEFAFHIAGTSHYQDALARICGGRSKEGLHEHDFDCAALLVPEPWQPFHRSAVAVSIRGVKVGYLHRRGSGELRKALRHAGFADAACEAMIIGGWDRGKWDQGLFGVRLNARLPFRLCSAEQWKRHAGGGRS